MVLDLNFQDILDGKSQDTHNISLVSSVCHLLGVMYPTAYSEKESSLGPSYSKSIWLDISWWLSQEIALFHMKYTWCVVNFNIWWSLSKPSKVQGFGREGMAENESLSCLEKERK